MGLRFSGFGRDVGFTRFGRAAEKAGLLLRLLQISPPSLFTKSFILNVPFRICSGSDIKNHPNSRSDDWVQDC